MDNTQQQEINMIKKQAQDSDCSLDNSEQDDDNSNIKDKKALLIAILRLYSNKIQEQKVEVKEKRDKLTVCVNKIQKEIDSQEIVKENKKKAEALKVTIEDKKAKMYQLERECAAIRFEIEQMNMEQMQPIVSKIESALYGISNQDVINLSVQDKPSCKQFAEVLRAVQIILGEKQQDWQSARQMMKHRGKNQNALLLRLSAFDWKSVNQEQIEQIQEIMNDETMNPELIAGKSKAAGAFAQWAQGILEYFLASKLLFVKKEELNKLQKKMQQDEEDVQNNEKLHQNFIDAIKQKIEDMGLKILQNSWQSNLDSYNTVAKQIHADHMAVKKSIEWLEEDSSDFEGLKEHSDNLDFKYNYFSLQIECLSSAKLIRKAESDIDGINFCADIMQRQEELAVDCFLKSSEDWFKSKRQ